MEQNTGNPLRLGLAPLRKTVSAAWMRLVRSVIFAAMFLSIAGDAQRWANAMQPPAVGDSGGLASSREVNANAQRLLQSPSDPADAGFGQQLVQTARVVGRNGDLETALKLLSRALDHYQTGPLAADHLAIFTIRLGIASAGWQLGRHDLVIQQSEALLEMPAQGNDLKERIAARQLLAKSWHQVGRFDKSLQATRELAGASPIAKSLAADQALLIGAAALAAGQLEVATAAYQFYLAEMPQGARTSDAVLGVAWAAAWGAQPPEQAEMILAEFIETYPDHHDLPHAIAARAGLLERLGRVDNAESLRLRLVADYPESASAVTVLDEVIRSRPAPWPDPVRAGWLARLATVQGAESASRGRPDETAKITVETVERLLIGALATGDDPLWQATVAALIVMDLDGTPTTEVLNQLSLQATGDRIDGDSHAHVAEHLAIDILGKLIDFELVAGPPPGQPQPADKTQPAATPGSLPSSCEAVCRWAGINGRWSLLALVADQSQPPEPGNPQTLGRGVAIDRLLAESLMQTRRGQDAWVWWEAIIGAWQCNDFPTLVRGAETAVAYGTVEAAQIRLPAAKAAAGEDGFRLSLVRMLEAELAIRRARMDEARGLLSEIVRATDTAAELRPRAQWLIGETYFLQQKYAEAIDAYRRVDTLDAGGEWAAVSLLQAGKAFEKLGRPREAATCYTALLTRFSDLPHASHARTRLAQLSGDAPLRR